MKIRVFTHSNAKKPRIEKDQDGKLHVYVSQPAIEGKANMASIQALAEHFKVKKNNVILLSGHKSKLKLFKILL